MRCLGEVEAAFSGSGIKSFILEGALGELQVWRSTVLPCAPRHNLHCNRLT